MFASFLFSKIGFPKKYQGKLLNSFILY